MTAEIVSVGTEILLGDIVDTNAGELGRAFAQYGLVHLNRQSVGDNFDRLVAALKLALSRSDVVFTIGGLGPTEDDMTRSGISAALDRPLILDPDAEAHIRGIFERRGMVFSDAQKRQAMKPTGAEIVSNPNGTAPGLICHGDGKIIVALPGPRNEFVPMVKGALAPFLSRLGTGEVIHSRTLKFVGIGESLLEAQLTDLMQGSNPSVAPYAKTAEVHLRITARATDVPGAEELIKPVEEEIRRRLSKYLYGRDEETLADAAVNLLREKGKTLAVAESCTGGGLGEFLTSVPGSSDAFLGGFITYSNAMKARLLGVPEEILATHGAVSEECAIAMAQGARKATGADFALSVTGLAGPGGGTEEIPVGLVFVACDSETGTRVIRSQWMGTREAVRERAQKTALLLLRRVVLRLED